MPSVPSVNFLLGLNVDRTAHCEGSRARGAHEPVVAVVKIEGGGPSVVELPRPEPGDGLGGARVVACTGDGGFGRQEAVHPACVARSVLDLDGVRHGVDLRAPGEDFQLG